MYGLSGWDEDYVMHRLSHKYQPKDITMALTAKVRTLDLAYFVTIYFDEINRFL